MSIPARGIGESRHPAVVSLVSDLLPSRTGCAGLVALLEQTERALVQGARAIGPDQRVELALACRGRRDAVLSSAGRPPG